MPTSLLPVCPQLLALHGLVVPAGDPRLDVRASRPPTVSLWASFPVPFALLLVLLDVWSWSRDVWVEVEGIPLSLASPVAVAAMVVWVVRCRPPLSASVMSAVAAVVLVSSLVVLSMPFVTALLVSASTETAVYFVAVPALVLAVSRRFLPPVWATVSAVAVSAAVFAALPGHVAQYGVVGPLPWLGMAVLWSWMLWRHAPAWSVACQHAGLNAAAFASVWYVMPAWWWPLALTAPIVAYVVFEGVADRRRSASTPAPSAV
jgi:hypothetical protein